MPYQEYEPETIDADLKNLMIENPNQYLMFCVYTPMDDMNTLQVFNIENFEQQIEQSIAKT